MLAGLLFAVGTQTALAWLASAEGVSLWSGLLTADFRGGLRVLGSLLFALACGLMTAAVAAARHGAALEMDED